MRPAEDTRIHELYRVSKLSIKTRVSQSWVSRATWVSYEQVSFDVLSFMKKDNIITSDKGLLSVVIKA